MTPNDGSGDVTLTELAGALISVFEGCELTAYRDVGGVFTVGFGHTGKVNGQPIAAGMTITQDEANAFLQEDAFPLFRLVSGLPILEAAALVSFGFNCGSAALLSVVQGHSTLIDYDKITDRETGAVSVSLGLQRRRMLEEVLIVYSQQTTKVTT